VKRWPWQVWLIVVCLVGVVYVFAMVFVIAGSHGD
jgi:hypothetical protein